MDMMTGRLPLFPSAVVGQLPQVLHSSRHAFHHSPDVASESHAASGVFAGAVPSASRH